MKNSSSIRSLLALLLLLVFSVSITPKQYLHDAVTRHHHDVSKHRGDVHLENKGFPCACDNLVSISPFVFTEEIFRFEAPDYFTDQRASLISRLFFISINSINLRGPPSIV